jgi:hypothetical protein
MLAQIGLRVDQRRNVARMQAVGAMGHSGFSRVDRRLLSDARRNLRTQPSAQTPGGKTAAGHFAD